VVIDTSPGIGAEVNDFLSSADQVLLVTTTEPTSLRDTYAALKSMAAFCHNDSSISLVVNMAASETQAAQAVEVLNEVTGRFLDRCFDDWRRIAVDSLVGRSVRARKPLVCEYPRSAASLSLRQIAGELKLPKRSRIPAQASRRR
jgi:flagellar biosynthesis protein FlhG